MCVFYYEDVSVRKGVVIKDVHASKPVLGVGLDVDVPTVRIRSLPTVSDNNKVEREELLSDHRVRQMYNSEVVEDIDGPDTTGDYEDDREDDENLSEEE